MESTNKELAYKEFVAAKKKKVNALTKVIKEKQRKEENEEYTALMASDAAAKELLESAKNQVLQSKALQASCKEQASVQEFFGLLERNAGFAGLLPKCWWV